MSKRRWKSQKVRLDVSMPGVSPDTMAKIRRIRDRDPKAFENNLRSFHEFKAKYKETKDDA